MLYVIKRTFIGYFLVGVFRRVRRFDHQNVNFATFFRDAPFAKMLAYHRGTRDRLSRANAAVMGAERDPFYGAPVVLVVLAEKSRRTYVHDGSLVMENLMLAAHALGVGSCWIHRAAETFAQPEWKEWLSSLGLEGDYEGIGNCILGYPDGEAPAAPARREGRVFYAESEA